MATNSKNNCLHYWDLCTAITIDAAVALWCDVEPSLLKKLDYSTSCMDVKRELIEQALYDRRLEYRSSSDAWHNANLDELINKDQVRINKDSLRRWFEDMPTGDRPAFLFDESRTGNIPDGGEVAEMNADKALAVMAWLLCRQLKKYTTGEKPNASAIANDVLPLAQEIFGDEVKLASFNKRLGKALKNFDNEKKKSELDVDF
jgi:hypothetical protein